MPTETLTSFQQLGFPILSLMVLLPAVGAAMLWAGAGPAPRRLAAWIAGAQLVLAALVLAVFDRDHVGLQLADRLGPWQLGIDGLSVLFLPLTALLAFLAVLAADPGERAPAAEEAAEPAPTPDARDEGRYLAAILGFSAILTAAFAAADIRLFWLFLTLEILPAWFLVSRFGGGGRLRAAAARDFLVVTGLAAGLSLIGLELLIGQIGGSGFAQLLGTPAVNGAQGAVFVILALAFAVRAPVFPLHGWLPRLLEHGPITGLGVFLVGVKVGTYGLLRFVVGPLPEAAAHYGWILAALGGVGAIYGGVMALIQTDLRRLLAFASIAHMGVIVIGLFSGSAHGIEGGLLQMLTIGMAVAGLYLMSSFIARRVGTPDLANLGALAERAPWLAGLFLVTALGAVGFPGTSGFNGEHLVVIGAYEKHPVFALMIAASTVLTAAYLLRFFQRAFMNPARAEARTAAFADLAGTERAVAGAVAGLVLLVGLWTGPFIALTRASATGIADHAAHSVHAAAEPAPLHMAVAGD